MLMATMWEMQIVDHPYAKKFRDGLTGWIIDATDKIEVISSIEAEIQAHPPQDYLHYYEYVKQCNAIFLSVQPQWCDLRDRGAPFLKESNTFEEQLFEVSAEADAVPTEDLERATGEERRALKRGSSVQEKALPKPKAIKKHARHFQRPEAENFAEA